MVNGCNLRIVISYKMKKADEHWSRGCEDFMSQLFVINEIK